MATKMVCPVAVTIPEITDFHVLSSVAVDCRANWPSNDPLTRAPSPMVNTLSPFENALLPIEREPIVAESAKLDVITLFDPVIETAANTP
jgi:hypothetical protein